MQVLLLRKELPWKLSFPMVWLSFWGYASSAGYLVVGGVQPFGDVEELVNLGVLTGFSSLLLGVILFLVGFILLSQVLFRLLTVFIPRGTAKFAVNVFWAQIPVLAALTALRTGFPFLLLAPSFAPVALSLALEHLVRN